MIFDPLLERPVSKAIIECFFEVYNTLGFGFREHVYSLALESELVARGLSVQREVTVPVRYKGKTLTTERLDMIVEDRVLVENKCTAALPASAEDQLLNYLKARLWKSGYCYTSVQNQGFIARFTLISAT
jgi:GxxExxY protein